MRVLILHDEIGADARPDESDALVQAEEIAGILHALGHEVTSAGVGLALDRLAGLVRERRAELVFNLVESLGGHGRLIHFVPAMLDALGVAYTGSPTEAVFTTSSKILAKAWMRAADLPTPWSYSLEELESRRGEFRAGTYIVKSVWEDASLGLEETSIVGAGSHAELAEEIHRRLPSLGGSGFAEEFIEGREFNLSILAGSEGPEVLPAAEIVFEEREGKRPRIVGYRAKWEEKSAEYSATPRRFDFPAADHPLLAELAKSARKAYDLFGLRGWGRVDYRVDGEGRPWILEVNVNPCLSQDAGFAAAVRRAGLSMTQAVERILADAMARTGTNRPCSASDKSATPASP